MSHANRSVRTFLSFLLSFLLLCPLIWSAPAGAAGGDFTGKYYSGTGDVEYLRLLDISRRMFEPDPEFQNMAMLYSPAWDGFVEGPKWGAWWIQNSYGPTYCALPFYTEPWTTFLVNANDLWFQYIGDGKPYKSPFGGWQYVAPDGQLCDAAAPGGALHKQGDGRVAIHDFGMEFTAAGVVMQSELLLISRDEKLIAHYLPLLERSANFIETRREPTNNLFLAGPAGNLLAPSYAGWKKPDGTYDKAYLAGLSVNYIAGLDRLIEVEKLAGNKDKAALYTQRRDLAKKGLPLLTTDEGYLVKYMDPDGTRHGVYGAKTHGYFEATCNHDAICFRVVDDEQARKIYAKIASIPGIRPHQFIIPNYPGLDDMYENGGIFQFGMWVNGGHWSTCEARMILAYYRLGKYADIVASMNHLMGFARRFQMDNPMTECGNNVWFKDAPINLCYDTLGPPAAMIRGLFEYLYTADGVKIVPHIPPAVTRLEQNFPIRLGAKRLYLATTGSGPVTAVTINGQAWKKFDAGGIPLTYADLPATAVIQIVLGEGTAAKFEPAPPSTALPDASVDDAGGWGKNWGNITVTTLPLRIGADGNGGTRFVGDIRRARVCGRAMSDAQIAALAADPAAAPPKDSDLVGDWSFDQGKGGVFANAAGDFQPAKTVGKVAVVDAPGGKAVRLDGSGYLEVAPDKRLDFTTECTLEAWICPGKLDARGGRIIDKAVVGSADGYLLDTFPGGSLRLIVERGVLPYDARLQTGTWYHVAATVDKQGRRKLYVNGKPVASAIEAEPGNYAPIKARMARLRKLYAVLAQAGMTQSYEAAHIRLAARQLEAIAERIKMEAAGTLPPLPPSSQLAADRSYFDAADALISGLEKVLASYEKSPDPRHKQIWEMWAKTGKTTTT